MNVFAYSNRSANDIFAELEVDHQKGLTSKEASRRLNDYGHNHLINRYATAWQILLRQFKSAFIYLLIAAAVIAFLLGERIDGVMILVFLLINAGLGFFQEYRSEKTLELLSKYLVSYTTVLRGGKKETVDSELLVPGDIVFLETGNKIPADVYFSAVDGLSVDESVLTGESIAVYKQSGKLDGSIQSYYQAKNLGFSGTVVVDGTAQAVVIATGEHSSIGAIYEMSAAHKKVSDYENNISEFSNFIMKLVIFTIVFVFIANIIIKRGQLDIGELLIFCVAMTVSVIPEALPVVTTFSLSRGAHQLAKKKVIVKRLSAVEDLGGIQVLCTDKTGTLTENKLVVAETLSQNSEDLIVFANLAGNYDQKQKLEPFDKALWEKATPSQQTSVMQYRLINEMPFDPHLRRNITLVANKSHTVLISRGAPEVIFSLCQLAKDQDKRVNDWAILQGIAGRRVLAIAQKGLSYKTGQFDEQVELERQTGFELLGMISFEDPIKESAFEVVYKAKKLGVQIKIITGDSPEVAGAVAQKIGISKYSHAVMTADMWEAMDPEKRRRALDEYSVFARVSPEQKFKIVTAYQQKYQTGFLGEGINDAPVLKAAGVAMAVNTASDIARESADILLLQKNLTIILDAISEGRRAFANTTKYIKATLASNFGNFFALITVTFVIDYLPMLPLQILLLNLLSDFPMISVATDNVDDQELIAPKHYRIKNILLFSLIFGLLSTLFDFLFFGIFHQFGSHVLQTNWFIASILTELVLIFSSRTIFPFYKAHRPSAVLIVLSVLAFGMTILIPLTAYGRNLFSFVRPLNAHLLLIVALVGLYFVLNEFLKRFYYGRLKRFV